MGYHIVVKAQKVLRLLGKTQTMEKDTFFFFFFSLIVVAH